MIYPGLFLGLVLIAGGVLFRIFPQLAQYNNLLSDQDRKQMDFKALARVMYEVFAMSGLLLVAINCILIWSGLEVLAILVNIIGIFITVVVVFLKGEKLKNR